MAFSPSKRITLKSIQEIENSFEKQSTIRNSLKRNTIFRWPNENEIDVVIKVNEDTSGQG